MKMWTVPELSGLPITVLIGGIVLALVARRLTGNNWTWASGTSAFGFGVLISLALLVTENRGDITIVPDGIKASCLYGGLLALVAGLIGLVWQRFRGPSFAEPVSRVSGAILLGLGLGLGYPALWIFMAAGEIADSSPVKADLTKLEALLPLAGAILAVIGLGSIAYTMLTRPPATPAC
jgi:hypothetical protein